MADHVRWDLERPVDCQHCIGQGNHANTPRILIENNPQYEGAPRGAVACRWCGYEITAPTLSEAIHKWRQFQELIRLGYTVLNTKDGCDGCLEKGKWENEKEYGYSSPCTTCKRQATDNWHCRETVVGKFKVITLCGSTRFKEEYDRVARELDAKGYIVWSCVTFSHYEGVTLTEEEIVAHKEKHQQKIALSDEIYVINKDGYIGESVKEEIAYAIFLGKKISYMEEVVPC